MADAPVTTPWWDRRGAAALLLALLAVVYLSNLGRHSFLGADEPRYARIAEEMARRGDAVVPTYRGTPWLEKPPLLYWLAGASFRFFGVSEHTARVPSALAALGLVAMLGWAIRGVYGRRMAFFAMLALSTSMLFLGFAAAATTDILITATVGAGLLLLWRYLDTDGPAPLVWLLGAAALFGLGCLAKGPLALVIPALVVYPWLALTGRVRELTLPHMAAGVLVFLAVTLPWYVAIYQREGFYFLLVFFVNHHLARYLTDIHHHTQPFWYYLPVVLIGALPWTLFLLMPLRRLREAFRDRSTDPRAAGYLFFALWLAVPLLFFSVSKAKLPGYILPLFPAVAALCAWGIERFLDGTSRRLQGLMVAAVCFDLLILAAIPAFFHIRFGRVELGLLLSALLLPGAVGFIECLRRRRRDLAVVSVAVAVLLPLLAATPVLVPALEPYFSHKKLCRQALRWTTPANPLVIYRNFHYTNDYYSDYSCTDNLPEPVDLRRYLAGRSGPVYLLTERKSLEDLAGLTGWRSTELGAAGVSVLLKLEAAP